jgi:hypothetical protein
MGLVFSGENAQFPALYANKGADSLQVAVFQTDMGATFD